MFDPELLRAEKIVPGLTPPIGLPTPVLALAIPPATFDCPERVMLPAAERVVSSRNRRHANGLCRVATPASRLENVCLAGRSLAAADLSDTRTRPTQHRTAVPRWL